MTDPIRVARTRAWRDGAQDMRQRAAELARSFLATSPRADRPPARPAMAAPDPVLALLERLREAARRPAEPAPLTRRAAAIGKPCPVCGRTMRGLPGGRNSPSPQAVSFDHHLPRERRPLLRVHVDRGGRFMCRECNQQRADAGHCVAALACAAAVAGGWDRKRVQPLLRALRRGVPLDRLPDVAAAAERRRRAAKAAYWQRIAEAWGA